MRHGMHLSLVGDVMKPVRVANVNDSRVASTQVQIVEERNGQVYRSSFTVEAWNELSDRLAAVPVGNTIMVQGKLQNKKYTDPNGEEKWIVKIAAFAIADAGESIYGTEAHAQPRGNARGSPQNSGPRNQTSRTPQGAYRQQAAAPAFDPNEEIPF